MHPTGGERAPTSLDDFLLAFETAWSPGEPADPARFLPDPCHPLHREALRELVRVDIEFRWQRGRPWPLDEYLRLFPALTSDPHGLCEVAYEEYRQRRLAGQAPDPADYESRYGVPTADWSRPAGRPDPDGGTHDLVADETPAPPGIPGGATERPRVSLVPVLSSRSADDVPALLRRRLRLVSLGAVGVLAYFAALGLATPRQKVGLFLERWPLVALNWLLLLVCAALAAALWSRRPLAVGRLRRIESALVGLLAAEMALGLASDLFLDRELRQPLAEGDHALFHYASSWSLPFFALVVGYGALVPATARRCAAVVTPLALAPLGISAAAGVAEGAIGRPFLLSFLLQMALWMAAGAAVAAYGAHRVEVLRREASEARRVGQYRLGRRLGAGSMGEVYLAEHVLLRRPCAVKVVRPEMAGDPRTVEDFEREARAAASMTHPNACAVFDYGAADDGTFYLAMEYLPGPSLAQLVARVGPLPPGRAVHLLRQVCGALAEAHAAGLVHRDVKPSNVIVCDRGGVSDVAKLLDFGLVHGYDGQGGTGRQAGVGFAGTPAYASPEQAAGRGGLDARSDVYSLGAVAYFLVTGRPPFVRGSSLETLAAHGRDPVVPPRAVRADVPADLEAVVLRCLEKDPGGRYPDAASLERALAGCAGT